MGFVKKCLNFADDTLERLHIKWQKRNEIKKYKNPKRVAIYSKVTLTKEQMADIDALYGKEYGEKIPYTWHRHFTAFTGRFDAGYFPESMFIPEFERYMSLYREYAKVFTDKNMVSMLADAASVKSPKSYFSRVKGIYRNKDNRAIPKDQLLAEISSIGEVFIKPTVDTSSGQGCTLADFSSGIDKRSGKTAAEIIEDMGNDFVVQSRIKCHESITKIYGGSVNTFRIITYRWKDKILSLPIIMRIGSGGGFVDNAHAGGMFIAVDDDGTLHKTAFTEFKCEFTEHPDTHLVFEGYKIDGVPAALAAAKRLHECVPQIGCVNWDLTLDSDGEPVLIEANMNNGNSGGSIWLCEMAHGVAPFGDNTREVLRWLRVMKRVPKSKWHKYAFGNM